MTPAGVIMYDSQHKLRIFIEQSATLIKYININTITTISMHVSNIINVLYLSFTLCIRYAHVFIYVILRLLTNLAVLTFAHF